MKGKPSINVKLPANGEHTVAEGDPEIKMWPERRLPEKLEALREEVIALRRDLKMLAVDYAKLMKHHHSSEGRSYPVIEIGDWENQRLYEGYSGYVKKSLRDKEPT